MRPSTPSLAMRRPGLAALLGVLPSAGEPHFGGDYGEPFGGFSFGAEDVLTSQGVREADPLGTLGALHADRSMLTADQARLAHMAYLEEERRRRAIAHMMELDPNHGQSLKLGHYSFGLSIAITIGIAASLYASDSPSTTIRTKNVVMNAPCVGFASVSNLLIANVAVTVGGQEDAYAYSAGSFSNHVDYPTLPPSQKATFSGGYSGLAPAPLFAGMSMAFSVRLSGKSTIAGGA